jgi:hypothetical protein
VLTVFAWGSHVWLPWSISFFLLLSIVYLCAQYPSQVGVMYIPHSSATDHSRVHVSLNLQYSIYECNTCKNTEFTLFIFTSIQ